MRSNSLLADLLISTLYLALFYFAMSQMRQQVFAYFAHIVQMLDFSP